MELTFDDYDVDSEEEMILKALDDGECTLRDLAKVKLPNVDGIRLAIAIIKLKNKNFIKLIQELKAPVILSLI